jgi:hypothetical protein
MQGRADREAGQTGQRRVASSTSPSAAALRASARSLRVEPLLRRTSAQTRAKDSICTVSCQAPLWAAAAYFLAAHRDCNHRRVLAVSASRSGSETSLSRNSCQFQWLKERHCTAPTDVRNDKLQENTIVSVHDELRISHGQSEPTSSLNNAPGFGVSTKLLASSPCATSVVLRTTVVRPPPDANSPSMAEIALPLIGSPAASASRAAGSSLMSNLKGHGASSESARARRRGGQHESSLGLDGASRNRRCNSGPCSGK